MPARHTRDAQLALLLPMAISQGWTVRDLAKRANIGNGEACEALRKAAEQVGTALGNVVTIDALSLSVEIQGKTRTLGEIQGKMVTGAARSLATLPENPHEWTQSNDQTYRRCQTILRDAKALGLIRFGEADKGANPPAMRHIDPFTAQNEGRKQGKSEKSQENEAAVNDGASPLDGHGVDNPPAQGEGEE
jgi:predicted NBD/HSP70 family sugar kinase